VRFKEYLRERAHIPQKGYSLAAKLAEQAPIPKPVFGFAVSVYYFLQSSL